MNSKKHLPFPISFLGNPKIQWQLVVYAPWTIGAAHT